MSGRYVCGEEGRRRAVRDPDVDLNGIDFLEVSENQRLLSVHFLKTPVPAGIGPQNVLIEGGERVTDVRVLEAAVEDDILNATLSGPGDSSLYTLRLIEVAGLDPRLSAVRFSFKVHCPTDFDCRPAEVCPPAVFQNPDIDYLARDYASLRQLMLDRLSALVPDWRERNPADLGVALVEMLAYVGDHLHYFLDAIGTDCYLETARRRISVRRHARLRDYFMHEGANARTYVTFEVDEDVAAGPPLTLPRRTQLLTRFGSNRTVVSSDALPEALAAGAMVFETLDDLTLHVTHNRIPFHTWSDARCCLPEGATAATLRGPLPDLVAGDLLLFEEVGGARTGAAADADPSRRHVVRLARVEPDLDPLDGTPVVEIEWHDADALPFPLCLSSVDDGGTAIEEVSVARGNVGLADRGRARHEHALVFSGGAEGALTVEGLSLTHAVPLPDNHRDRPAAELGQPGPQHALPQIRLFAGDQPWEVRRDLLGSRNSDRHFVAEMEEDGRARLRFGDNEHGMRPETGTEFTAEYREGNGPHGNIGARTIGHVVDAPPGILSVQNPLPAWGGEAPESLERVRAFAPEAFKVQERAVTEADYAEIAERHPEVQRAAATIRCTGSWSTVFLTIDRLGGRPVVEDGDFVGSMLQHMDRFRMAGHDLEIRGPRFVPLDIAIIVCVEPEYLRGEIQAELQQHLGSRGLPDGRRAFFHPDLWSFGQSVYLSQIYAAIMSVPGVASAEVKRFQRWGRVAKQELNTGVLRVERLEVVRLDNDPNFQENGRLQLTMLGGR
jgi:hypothetical protein